MMDPAEISPCFFHRKSSPLRTAVCLGGEALPKQREVVLQEHPPHGCSQMSEM